MFLQYMITCRNTISLMVTNVKSPLPHRYVGILTWKIGPCPGASCICCLLREFTNVHFSDEKGINKKQKALELIDKRETLMLYYKRTSY